MSCEPREQGPAPRPRGEARFESIFRNLPDAVVVFDLSGTIELFNQAAEGLFGYRAGEVLGLDILRILTESEVSGDRAQADGLPDGFIKTGAREAWGRTRDGSVFPIEMKISELRTPAETFCIAIIRDISRVKHAEEELRGKQEQLQQAVQLANLGHCVWDSLEDRCIFCSEVYAAIHGVTPDEYIAMAATEEGSFNHPDDHEDYRRAIGSLRRGQGFELEYRVVTPQGETRVVREIAKPFFDDGGRVIQEVCTIQDITALKQSEERLQQAIKMEAVGQLTGGVAHDFNNLLAVIQGNAELLLETTAGQAPMVRSILRASQRGADLTQRLLAFSRQQPLNPRPIDLGALVAGMSDLLQRTLGETVEIRTALDSDLRAATADPGQVESALLNLAINARDAMPSGGRLTIECTNARLDDDYVMANPDADRGDYVMLAVTDSGAGMSDAVRAQAFEPFFTTKEVGEGSGLGLSMVYGFAKQSGGHVTIYSEAGRGTTVKIYLPRADGAAASVPAPRGDIPNGKGERILVVEDDPDVRQLAVTILEGLGYTVVDVADAAGARVALGSGPRFDLVLSDVVLPGGDSGPKLAREAQDADPDLKVIFMSGYPAESAKNNGFLGSDSVLLNKPFHRRELAVALRAALDGSQAR